MDAFLKLRTIGWEHGIAIATTRKRKFKYWHDTSKLRVCDRGTTYFLLLEQRPWYKIQNKGFENTDADLIEPLAEHVLRKHRSLSELKRLNKAPDNDIIALHYYIFFTYHALPSQCKPKTVATSLPCFPISFSYRQHIVLPWRKQTLA
jgi:hypothetical protein